MRFTPVFVLLSSITLLSACGGGGSSSDPVYTPPSPPVSGRAVKGVLQQAEVLAYRRAGTGWSLARSTVTDDEGRFTFAGGLPAGVVKIEVQPATSGISRMVCDAASGCGAVAGPDIGDVDNIGYFDFGETMPMPEGFRMSTIIPGERPADYEVAISPVTHLMASYLERLPVKLQDKHVAMARAQIEGLLDVDENFLWQAPPDLTDAAEVDAASADALHHALVSAAFAEIDGAQPHTVLNTYAYRYAGLAGQLPVSYGASMHALAAAAQDVLAYVNSLRAVPLDAGAAFTEWAALEGTLTRVALSGEHNPDNLARARLSLDELDSYLDLAGINEDGDYLANQAAQFNYLNNQAMLGLLQVTFESVVAVVEASLTASAASLPDAEPLPTEIPINSVSDGFTASLKTDVTPMLLTISGESATLGQEADIIVEITPLLSGFESGMLTFALQSGEITNDSQVGTMSGSLSVQFLEPARNQALYDALMADPEMMDPATEAAIETFLANLRVRASIAGNMSLADATDPLHVLTGDIDAFAEIDIPAVMGEGDLLQIEVTSGQLQSPNGDSLYSLEGAGPALRITVDDSATLDAAFGFETAPLPAMEVTANGALNGIDALVGAILVELSTLESFDPASMLSVLTQIDISLLDLVGTGTLDIPADGKAWQFGLHGNRFDVSQPNSTEDAFSFYLASLEGGFILSGGEPVAAVTIDWMNLGAAIYSIDGEVDHYYTASLEGLLAGVPVSEPL